MHENLFPAEKIQQKFSKSVDLLTIPLFTRLINEISPQLETAKKLISEASENKENRNILLARLSVIGAYIKRRGNLFIISEDKKLIKAKEVEFCINAFFSCEVKEKLNLGSHMLFIGEVKESVVFSKAPSCTYAYYHSNIKKKFS